MTADFQFELKFDGPVAELQHSAEPDAQPCLKLTVEEHDTDCLDVMAEVVAIKDDAGNVVHTMFRRTLKHMELSMLVNDDLTVSRLVDARSDLIPNVYEGGLKTWECSMDLLHLLATRCLPTLQSDSHRVLEIGCGSALPGIFCMQFDGVTRVDFQDYNAEVLRNVTLPNILLNTTALPAEHTIVDKFLDINDLRASDTNRVRNFGSLIAGDWSGLAACVSGH